MDFTLYLGVWKKQEGRPCKQNENDRL